MFLDNSLILSNAQAVTVTAPSTVVYDVTGAGAGNAPALVFGANTTIFGEDIGAGDGLARPALVLTIPVAFVTGGGATLQIQLQAAIDNGSNSPSTYTTIVQTDALPATALTLGATINIPVPPLTFGEALPRFYRVNYVVGTSTFSAGKITAAIAINPTSTFTGQKYPENFIAV